LSSDKEPSSKKPELGIRRAARRQLNSDNAIPADAMRHEKQLASFGVDPCDFVEAPDKINPLHSFMLVRLGRVIA
jgi:hypothetical protein